MSDKWYISGPLAIGTPEPTGQLTLEGIVQPGQGRLTFFSNSADVEYDGGSDGIFVFRNTAANGETVFIGDTSWLSLDTNADTRDSGILLKEGGTLKWWIWNDAREKQLCISRDGLAPSLTINESGNVGITKELTVGAGGNAVMRSRHIEGKSGQNDDADALYLNWVSGKDVQIGESSRRSNLTVWGNVGIGTTSPVSGRLQFDNSLGNKVVIYDNGQTDRYGFGLNGGNLNAFVPAGGRFSIRQNGHDGTEVMTVTGVGDTTLKGNLFWGGDASDSFYIILGTVQICWGTFNFDIPVHFNSQDVAFPHSFGKSPSVLISLHDPGAHPTEDRELSLTCGVGARGVTVSGFKAICKTSKNEDRRQILCTWIAIGKA
jgi:hypothetical protein